MKRHMKRYCIFLLLMVVGIISVRAENSTNSFGIYLVTGNATGDLSHVQPAKTPVISDADIVSYDFAKHLVKLKPKAFTRIRDRDRIATPFVLKVNRTRIYLGVFVSPISAVSYDVPSIIYDERMPDPELPPDVLRISRSYPDLGRLPGPDPRSDARIKDVLAALHKLK